MNISNDIVLKSEEYCDLFYKLLKNEDFNFKTKDITININKKNKDTINIGFECKSIIDFKIASNSVIKSLEIIDKTLKIIENDL